MAAARRFRWISFRVFAGTWFVFGVACASPEQQLPAVKAAPPVASPALPVADADNEASRAGSLQREQQKIELSTLFCDHGTWQMLDCGTLDLVPCKGDPYQQSWSYSPGVFKLQGVQYDVDSFGTFNCGPNDC